MDIRTEVAPLEIRNERYAVVAKSHVGCVRDENQDYMGCFQHEQRLFCIVVDGMGGHSGGFEASRIAVQQMGEFFRNNPNLAPQKILHQSIQQSHKAIYERSQNEPALKGMGTTVVAALLDGDQLYLAHVGDSRAHLYRHEQLLQLTLDHSCVNSLALLGDIPLHQLEDHHLGHILERSLGGEDDIEIEVRSEAIQVQRGDRFLLSTDGFWQLSDEQAISDLLAVRTQQQCADQAIQHALNGGGNDNITVAVLDILSGAEDGHDPADVRVSFHQAVQEARAKKEASRQQPLPPPPEASSSLPKWLLIGVILVAGLLYFVLQ